MLYLCLRQTLDWSDEAAFWDQLPVGFAPTVRVWNDTFTIPYHIFRHRVREIARLNARELVNVAVAQWDDIPEGAWVLPADDDDWFAPNLAAVLEHVLDGDSPILGCHWTGSFLEVPLNFCHRIRNLERQLLRTPGKWICCTNNYAMRKTGALRTACRSHVHASHWFWDHPSQVLPISNCLSLMNRTLASRTSLRMIHPEDCYPIQVPRLLSRYRQYQHLYRNSLPAPLAWCNPWIAMMHDLMQELQLR